jgi:hypothetical protein|tara:strand:+ start:14290 stop:14598 length:309 start_codon:yes stop_codon:yes gene_type:complete
MLIKRVINEKNTIESYYNSSNVLKSIYHEGTADLDVVFKSGAVYRYRNVPPTVLIEFEHSKSQGKFLNKKIRDNYSSTKVVNVNTQQLIEHIQMLIEEKNKE